MKMPWRREPNTVVFKYKNYDCLILRTAPRGSSKKNPNDWLGTLCGYVGLPKGHQYYGMHYDKIPDHVQEAAHGGLTYSADCVGPYDLELWWIGFDCAHAGDIIPHFYEARMPGQYLHELHKEYGGGPYGQGETYRTIAFVKNKIRGMVKELDKVKTPSSVE